MSAATIYMDAELAPSRSLSANGYLMVMLVLGVFSLVMALYFLSFGYTPIALSLAVAFVGLWFVFRRSFAKLRQRTFIRVTAQSIDLKHIDGKGRVTDASLPSHFARVELDRSGPHPGRAIRIASAGRAYLVGKFLTPTERRDVIHSLRLALDNARSERFTAE